MNRLPRWTYDGRWALVTGASSGLGEEFARQLAARGMKLVLSARREERLRSLAHQLLEGHGTECVVVPADLARPDGARDLWYAAARDRDIDLLVNNAGFGAYGAFHEIELERLLEMVRVDCDALLALAHAAMPGMIARSFGAIVNLSSFAAFQPVPRMAAYAAAKAFVLSLSRAIATEARPAGVRVTALCPGRTPTEFQAVAGSGSTRRAFGVRPVPFVVRAGLRGLERGRAVVVPGFENRLASLLARAVPDAASGPVLEAIVRRAAHRGGASPPASG